MTLCPPLPLPAAAAAGVVCVRLLASVSSLFVMGHTLIFASMADGSRTTTNIASRPGQARKGAAADVQGDSSVPSCMCWANTARPSRQPGRQAVRQAALVVKFIYMLGCDDISRTHTHTELNTLSL